MARSTAAVTATEATLPTSATTVTTCCTCTINTNNNTAATPATTPYAYKPTTTTHYSRPPDYNTKATTDHKPALARGNMSIPPTQYRLLQTSEKTDHQAPRDMNPATHFGRKRVSQTRVSYTSQAARSKCSPHPVPPIKPLSKEVKTNKIKYEQAHTALIG